MNANLSDTLFKRGVEYMTQQIYTDAAMCFEEAAKLGHMTAQYNIAYCYENGLGVNQDYTNAFIWYLSSALQGEVDAMANTALIITWGGA